jgi:hypothetical protein
MKKMILKNWFWIVILIVAGIKYGTAQSLKAVKKYDLPVTIIETEDFSIESKVNPINGNEWYLIRRNVKYGRKKDPLIVPILYSLTANNYKLAIQFFRDVLNAPITEDNYSYELVTDNFFIEVKKHSNRFTGEKGSIVKGKRIGEKNFNEDDISFLASLPLVLRN